MGAKKLGYAMLNKAWIRHNLSICHVLYAKVSCKCRKGADCSTTALIFLCEGIGPAEKILCYAGIFSFGLE